MTKLVCDDVEIELSTYELKQLVGGALLLTSMSELAIAGHAKRGNWDDVRHVSEQRLIDLRLVDKLREVYKASATQDQRETDRAEDFAAEQEWQEERHAHEETQIADNAFEREGE